MVYDIQIYQSKELVEYCQDNNDSDWAAANNVKKAMEEVASWQNFSVDVQVRQLDDINPSREVLDWDDALTTACGSWGYYDGLLEWWRDRKECISSTASDSNLLLTRTSYTSGGRAHVVSPPAAVAVTGRYCADANLPSSFNDDSDFQSGRREYDALSTAIHEIGHNIIEYEDNIDKCSDACEDNDALDHRRGNANERDSSMVSYAATPMSANYIECARYNGGPYMCAGSENACFNEVPKEDDVTGIDLRFSDCTLSKL